MPRTMARVALPFLIATTCSLLFIVLASRTDSLLAAIKQKNYTALLEELSAEDLDVNNPTSSHRLPMLEAVRSDNEFAVKALLDLGALANSHEPMSGQTPLHVAFSLNFVTIALTLLEHGADPHATNQAGDPARQLASSPETAELLSRHEAEGAMAFESAPGSWLRAVDEEGDPYFWSPSTGETRWSAPPSCSWHRITVQGKPIRFINQVTGQQVTSLPPALAWALVAAEEEGSSPHWFNWAAGLSSLSPPAELPADMLEELQAAGSAGGMWLHSASGELSYSDPAYSTAWRELRDEATGEPYYFNVESGEAVWETPEELAWERVDGGEEGQQEEGQQEEGRRRSSGYYYNRLSGEARWEAPATG
ncbi:hypothetical protein Agub_g12265, partial [Astrephomene gubernaculifera]